MSETSATLAAALLPALHVSPEFDEKVTAVRASAAAGTLAVISDFDHTLTTPASQECHDIVGCAEIMPKAFRKAMGEMLDFSEPRPETPNEWWGRCNALMVEFGLRRHFVGQMVRDAPCFPRNGLTNFLNACRSSEVPLLIVSAGLSDVIEEFLSARCSQPLPDHLLRVSANRMVFGSDGTLQSFEASSPYHSHNKFMTAQREKDFLFGHAIMPIAGVPTSPRSLDHLIVLGDKPYDVDAASGVLPHPKARINDGEGGSAICKESDARPGEAAVRSPVPYNQLRIAFFDSRNNRYKLQDYIDTYDLVLPSESSGLEAAIAVLRR